MRRALAAIAAAGGLLALFAGTPYRVEHHVSAPELAKWIRERKPGLRIIDLRKPSEFDELHVPRSENVPVEKLASMQFRDSETIVLVSDGAQHAIGHRNNVHILRGGIGEWREALKQGEIGRYFGGVRRGGC